MIKDIKKYSIFVLILSFSSAQSIMNEFDKLSNDQLDEIRNEILGNSQSISISDNKEDNLENDELAIESIILDKKESKSLKPEKFGYGYFKNKMSFFDNVPAPANYLVGPGDQIIITLWGAKNFREKFNVTKDGMIYYDRIGFINVTNKNIDEIEEILFNEFSKIFATLRNEDNPTRLSVELAKLKSLNVYFTGEIINPGVHLIHPFSNIFLSIVQAGGIDENGSLRNVKLIRNNKVVQTIDFYKFFINGDSSDLEVKILDGDIIHVPTKSKTVTINGEILRTGEYELLATETLKNLLDYSGGVTANASSDILYNSIVPIEDRISQDYAKSSTNISLKQAEQIYPNNGDTFNVLKIQDVVSTVEIVGRVKNPGKFSSLESSLLDILKIAGGFDDPYFRESIDDTIVILRKNSETLMSKEYRVDYSNAHSFNVEPGDLILVYENRNFDQELFIGVYGEVNLTGNFPFTPNMTVDDAIELAGGLNQLGNINGISIKSNFYDNDTKNIDLSSTINGASLDYILNPGDIININRLQGTVNVQGNVYFPGAIAFNEKKSLNDYIRAAGGLKQNTAKRDIYITRANGESVKAKNLFFSKKIMQGDTINVPEDLREKFNVTTFIADLSTTLANIAAILIIVDNNK